MRRRTRHAAARTETRPARADGGGEGRVPPAGPAARWRGAFAAAGALCCAAAIALGAYAAHGLALPERDRIQPALSYLLVHGLALGVFAPRPRAALADAALMAWALGILLFCGSLILAVLAGTSTRLAPAGGVLLIAGWLLQGLHALRG
jgi:uncharacterized membrane protein YgdD (TMEM256/DUF423 family)